MRRKPIIFIASLVILAVLGYFWYEQKPSTVRAFGNLTVDMGVPSGQPIFTVTNWLPGDCETRTVNIQNDSPDPTTVLVRSDNEIATPANFPTVLDITITGPSGVLYNQSLQQFFSDSNNPNGVNMGNLNNGANADYDFAVCFQTSAGNDFQSAQVVFDLIFGELGSDVLGLPAECSHLAGIITRTIQGTPGNDEIRGTHYAELILGLGGNDELDGAGGDDCIVGGDGNDELDGGHGKDVILGGAGNDKVESGAGDDIIYGNDGNDKLNGGAGNDIIYAGSQNDFVNGGSGLDQIWGEAGNDILEGGSSNDKIDGGPGTGVSANTSFFIGKMWCYGSMTAAPLAQAAYADPITATNDGVAGVASTDGGWTCNGSAATNIAQSDRLVGDMTFYAEQVRNNGTFDCSSVVFPTPAPVVSPTP